MSSSRLSRVIVRHNSGVSLVLMRHGQSRWNARNRFTGWTDVALTPQGEQEAWAAGRLIGAQRLDISHAFTSELSRAQRTMELVLESIGQRDVDVSTNWRLNERHYGALTGLHKTETMERWGAEKVMAMRRGVERPPPMDETHPMWEHVHKSDEHPVAESLPETRERVWAYWQESILPTLLNLVDSNQSGTVLVVSHLHTIRLLIAELDGLSREELFSLEIPTAVPLLYEVDRERLTTPRCRRHSPPAPEKTDEQTTTYSNCKLDCVSGKWLGETKLPSMRISAIRCLLLRRRGLLPELLPFLPAPIQTIFRLDRESAFNVAAQVQAAKFDKNELGPVEQVAALRALYETRPWIGEIDEAFCEPIATALHAVGDDVDAPPRRYYDGLKSGEYEDRRRIVKVADFPAFSRLVAVNAYLSWIENNGADFLPEKEYSFAQDVCKTGLLSNEEITADLAKADERPFASAVSRKLSQQRRNGNVLPSASKEIRFHDFTSSPAAPDYPSPLGQRQVRSGGAQHGAL